MNKKTSNKYRGVQKSAKFKIWKAKESFLLNRSSIARNFWTIISYGIVIMIFSSPAIQKLIVDSASVANLVTLVPLYFILKLFIILSRRHKYSSQNRAATSYNSLLQNAKFVEAPYVKLRSRNLPPAGIGEQAEIAWDSILKQLSHNKEEAESVVWETLTNVNNPGKEDYIEAAKTRATIIKKNAQSFTLTARAYHEAGHVVAGAHAGLSLSQVNLTMDVMTNSGGMTGYGPTDHLNLLNKNFLGEWNFLVACYGGAAGERVYDKEIHYYSIKDDTAKALNSASLIFNSKTVIPGVEYSSIQDILDAGRKAADDIVNKHRDEVIAVAEKLEQRKVLGVYEIFELLPSLHPEK